MNADSVKVASGELFRHAGARSRGCHPGADETRETPPAFKKVGVLDPPSKAVVKLAERRLIRSDNGVTIEAHPHAGS